MPTKRPVTVAQARRWPAAAARRESFCARMGGMRERLTGERAARDPASRINRALAAWDCDEPEGLKREHVSKGVRMKITKGKVGSESRKAPARKNPARKTAAPAKKAPARKTAATYAVFKVGMKTPLAVFASRADAVKFGQSWADIHKAPVQVVAG